MNITNADREALALAPLLDEALGEPCSYDRAAKIYVAITPLLEAHHLRGVKAGLEAAAAYVQANYPHDKRALVPGVRAIDAATVGVVNDS